MTPLEGNSDRDIGDDDYRSLTFNCYEFSRYMQATHKGVSPIGRRVTASKCLCAYQGVKICDPTQLYEIHFRPQLTGLFFPKDTDLKDDPDVYPPDRIGAFVPADEEGKGHADIDVPPQLMDLLWEAALAADGVIREITLSVKPQKRTAGYWWVFSVSLHEEIWDDVELRVEKNKDGKFVPRLSPPRANPGLIELRDMREELKSVHERLQSVHERLQYIASWTGWPGVLAGVFVVAIGVLIALAIAHPWR